MTFSFLDEDIMGVDKSNPNYVKEHARFLLGKYKGIEWLKALPLRAPDRPYLLWFHGVQLDHCVTKLGRDQHPNCSVHLGLPGSFLAREAKESRQPAGGPKDYNEDFPLLKFPRQAAGRGKL